MPEFSSFLNTAGSAYIRAIAFWILSTIGRGVLAGATNPVQLEMSPRLGSPATIDRGSTSGSAGSGRLLRLAGARVFPALAGGMAVGGPAGRGVERPA